MHHLEFIKRHQHSLAIASSVLFVLLYFLYLQKLSPNFFLYDDNVSGYLPFYVFNWDSVVNNLSIPFVNLHQYLGHTYFSQGQTGVLYLPTYIAVFLSRLLTGNHFYTIDILVFMHLCLSVVAMYFLLKRLKLDTKVSLLFSLIWITYPFITIASKSWVFISYVAAFLPLNFILLDKLITKPSFKHAVILGALQAIFLYQGYIQYVFLLLIFEFLFLIILQLLSNTLSIDNFKNFISNIVLNSNTYSVNLSKSYLISKISFLCLSAPVLIPMFYQQQESFYRSSRIPYHDFINFSLDIIVFLKTQFAVITNYAVFGAGSEIYFIGIINLILLFLIFKKINRSNKKIITLAILSLAALILSTEFYSVFYKIPLFNLFRWPFKYFYFFIFFATLAIAVITSNLLKSKNALVRIILYIGLILTFGFNCYLVIKNPNNVVAQYHIKEPASDHINQYIDNHKGRVFTFGLRNIDSGDLHNYFTFNYATLYNKFHFSGYDPLLSDINNKLSFGLNHISSYNGTVNSRLLNYLSNWSVRYLITEDSQRHDSLSQFKQLELIYRDSNIRLYENHQAFPIVHYFDENIDIFRKVLKEEIDFEYKVNGIDIYPNNKEIRKVVVNIAPLELYKISIDGADGGFVKKTDIPLIIDIPANTSILSIKYIDYYFYTGLIICISFSLILLFIKLKNKNRVKN